MPSRLTGFVCPTVSMVTTGHATGVEKTLLGCVHGLKKGPLDGQQQLSLRIDKGSRRRFSITHKLLATLLLKLM